MINCSNDGGVACISLDCQAYRLIPFTIVFYFCGVKCHIAHIENSNKSGKEREKNSNNKIENEAE